MGMGMSMGMVRAAGLLASGLRGPLWHLGDALEHTCGHFERQLIKTDQAEAIAPARSPVPLRLSHPRGRFSAKHEPSDLPPSQMTHM